MTYESIKEKADAHWNDRAYGNTPLIRVGSAMCGHAAGAFRVKKTILENSDDASIKKQCLKENMFTLRRDGINKILYGLTTVEEILSITTA